MWSGFVAVDPNYDPIIYEGETPARVAVMNAGPSAVEVRAWDKPHPGEQGPGLVQTLLPGNIRTISGSLIRVHVTDKFLPLPWLPPPPYFFAAVGWEFV